MKVALTTPFLHHLPLHPSSYLGYGAAILEQRYKTKIVDLNARVHSFNKGVLDTALAHISDKDVVADMFDLHPLYPQLINDLERDIKNISWQTYQKIFITTPSWFVTVPTEAILNLADLIRNESEHSEILFFGNSLGSWTDAKRLLAHNIEVRHLNNLFRVNPCGEPVNFDALPTPVYKDREKYIFDILPFRLKHGCIWGKCKFCSLAKGWNSGYLERSVNKIIDEMEELIDTYDPKMLVCRDNSINGDNLFDFCACFEKFKKPWIGMARADLSKQEIAALQKAGCRLIYFGMESGSDRVLNGINKGIDSSQMSNFIRELCDQDIKPTPSLFVGAPDETENDFEKTVQFILDHRDYVDIINLYPLRMTPASEFTLSNEKSNINTRNRINTFIHLCEDTGIKVCIGEQSAEYILFKSVYPGQEDN